MLQLKNGTITSRTLAAWTGKQHKNVLRDIQEMEDVWSKSHGSNLSRQTYKSRGKEYPEYVLNKKQYLWIITKYSDEIRLKLIDRWEELELQSRARQQSRLECPQMTDAVKLLKEMEGKEAKSYHYINEMNLINTTVLGCTAKKWREANEIEDKEALRDTLTPIQIQAVQKIQQMNTNLIELGMDYEERKNKLNEYFSKFWSGKIEKEFLELNA